MWLGEAPGQNKYQRRLVRTIRRHIDLGGKMRDGNHNRTRLLTWHIIFYNKSSRTRKQVVREQCVQCMQQEQSSFFKALCFIFQGFLVVTIIIVVCPTWTEERQIVAVLKAESQECFHHQVLGIAPAKMAVLLVQGHCLSRSTLFIDCVF